MPSEKQFLSANLWVISHSGKKVGLGKGCEAPSLHDIAVSLGKICRFAGQGRIFWPVLLHSMVVADLVADEAKPYALLHDSAESMIGDIPRPFKPTGMKKIEKAIMHRVYESQGLKQPNHLISAMVKVADDKALVAEAVIVGPKGLIDTFDARPDNKAMDYIHYYLNEFSWADYLVPTGRAVQCFEESVRLFL